MIKQIPNRVLDKLRVHEWNEYVGENPMYKGYWVKGETAIKIDPARQMTRMYHLSSMTISNDSHAFIHEDKLNQIIEEITK